MFRNLVATFVWNIYIRYLLARELAKGKDVLDISSGEGYGTAMIAEVARWAAGVDKAPEAVNGC